ncbi:hypothetical protein WJX75_008232 [Coccomyxa subellipsoidea]|uniref:Uncharacterized protein n=1 Tax=Coccomyxa subellipsoidea TaxID=248742 RepID=A0ABR2YLL3_9CHLO
MRILAAQGTSEDVLLDPEACLTFKIGSDGVPVSESDCDSVLLASPVRVGINQVYGTPQHRGPSSVTSPLSRGYVTATASPAPSLPQEELSPARSTILEGAGEEQEVKVSPHSYPVTLSANSFCASEQPSHSLAASQSHLTVPLQNGLPPPGTQLQAHAVSAETGGFTGQEEETADTADSGGRGDTAELLGMQFGSAAAVVDVVRFLASSSSASGVSRRADSASASIGGMAAEVCIEGSERPMPGKNEKAVVDWAVNDASAGDAASAASFSTRGSGVAVIQPRTEAAMRAVGGLAAADGSGAASPAASPRAAGAAGAGAQSFPHPPSGLSRPGSARLDFHLADDGALSFPGRQNGVPRRTSAEQLDGLTSDSSPEVSGNGPSSSGAGSGAATTVQRARHTGASEGGRRKSASTNKSAAAGSAADVAAMLPSRPTTSQPQAGRPASSSAVAGEPRSPRKQTSRNGLGYANIKPRTNCHLELNYIPVTKASRRSDASAPLPAAAKPAWGSKTASDSARSSRSERAASAKAGQVKDSSRGRDTTMQPAEKLPYDALLGHVTNLLSEVRTALRQ